MANATVSGGFSTGGTGSCVTAANGQCTISSGNISRKLSSSTFTVTGVSGTSLSYTAPSPAPGVVVNKP